MIRSLITAGRRLSHCRGIYENQICCRKRVRYSYFQLGRVLSINSPQAGENEEEMAEHVEDSQPSTSTARTDQEIFGEIVDALMTKGHVVVLPHPTTNKGQSEGETRAELGFLGPIRALIWAGLESKHIISLFVKHPDLFKITEEQWDEKLSLLIETGFDVERGVLMLSNHKEIFAIPRRQLFNKLETIRQIGVKGHNLPKLVYSYPNVLTEGTTEDMRVAANNLKSFFTTDQVIQLITFHPSVLFQNFDDLEAKYEYIYFNMGIESDKFKKSIRWAAVPIEYIQMRHEILARTGTYIHPDPKRPMLSKDNPTLADILDTNEFTFSIKVAGISLEEYHVFRDMFNRQLEDEAIEAEYDDALDEMDSEEVEKEQTEEADKRVSPILDDEEDYGGWKKYKSHYYQTSGKRKTAMRKRKGRA